MSRQEPAIFHAEDASGRTWKIRVSPLGVEMTLHRARAYEFGDHTTNYGIERRSVAWRDLLPAGEGDDGGAA